MALFGHGFLGRWHAQKAQKSTQANLSLIIEPNEAQHQDLQSLYPETIIAKSIEGHESSFDAALIVTPTSYHFELCEKLIKLGKHVFCEKPITTTKREAEQIKSLLSANQVFQSGHSERCHSFWEDRDVQHWLKAPELSLESFRQSSFKGRATDVDVVQDLMIHDIDLMLWLLGENPNKVEARGFKVRTRHWDHAWARFSFPSGQMVTLHVGRNSGITERRWLANQNRGQLVLDLAEETATFALGDKADLDVRHYERRDHLLVEQEFFYRSILSGEKIFVGIEEGKQAVWLVEKTLEAIETGQALQLS